MFDFKRDWHHRKLKVEIDNEAKNVCEIKIGTKEKKKVKNKDKFEYKYLFREAMGMMLKMHL